MTALADDEVFKLTLKVIDLLAAEESEGDVHVAALLAAVAFLVTQADRPQYAAKLIKIGLNREIAAALASPEYRMKQN